MIYLYYAILVPISLILTLVGLVIAPVLPLFATEREGWLDNGSTWGVGPRLPTWLNWFMTPDNDLYGDATFVRINGKSYWSQVKWLWRNPAYSFGLRYLTAPFTTSVSGDPTIRDNDNARAGHCTVHANGLFLYRLVLPIGFSRCIYINIGWNIMALVDPNARPKTDPYEATFVFSPRISGFR